MYYSTDTGRVSIFLRYAFVARNRIECMVAKPSETRLLLGTFTLSGDDEQARLTISKRLDDYDFPNGVGDELKVEYVQSNGDSRLELTPAQEGGQHG